MAFTSDFEIRSLLDLVSWKRQQQMRTAYAHSVFKNNLHYSSYEWRYVSLEWESIAEINEEIKFIAVDEYQVELTTVLSPLENYLEVKFLKKPWETSWRSKLNTSVAMSFYWKLFLRLSIIEWLIIFNAREAT